MQGKTAEARKLGEQAFIDLRSALTPVQWDKLPESLKAMPTGRGFGGPDGGGDGGGRRPPSN